MPGKISHPVGNDRTYAFAFPSDGNDYSSFTLSCTVRDRSNTLIFSITLDFLTDSAGTFTVARATTSAVAPGDEYALYIVRTDSGHYDLLDTFQYELTYCP